MLIYSAPITITFKVCYITARTFFLPLCVITPYNSYSGYTVFYSRRYSLRFIDIGNYIRFETFFKLLSNISKYNDNI